MKPKILVLRFKLKSLLERCIRYLTKKQPPRRYSAQPTKQLKVYISEQTRWRLDHLTKKTKLSNSQAVTLAITASFEALRETAPDVSE